MLIPADAEAVLLVEHSGDDSAEVRDRLRQIVDRIRRKKQLAFDSRQAFDAVEVELFWQLARRVVPTLHRIKGSMRPIADCRRHGGSAGIASRLSGADAKHAQATPGHRRALRPCRAWPVAHPTVFGSDVPDDVQKMDALASELYADVFDVGGTISGEHGDGLSRTPFVRKQYGELYDVFRRSEASVRSATTF